MKFDYKNSGIYAGATHAYRANFVSVMYFSAMLIATELAMTFFDMRASLTFVNFMIQIIFAYIMHQTILSGEPVDVKKFKYSEQEFKKFLWRNVFILLALFLTLIPILIFAFTSEYQTEVLTIIILGFLLFVLIPLYGIFLALFGTMLPAAVADENMSFRAAYQRSRGQVLKTIFRLIYGPTLFIVSLSIILSIIQRAGIPIDIYDDSEQFNLIGTVISSLTIIVSTYLTTLGVVILCKAYLHATPETDIT